MTYDSTDDTLAHIARVRELLFDLIDDLYQRARNHDNSKLAEPEKSGFDEWTPKLKALTYGSDEYKAALAGLGEALAHHYANNSHHPEHYPAGITGMTLLDVLEMFVDWKAATERHADGNLAQSILINRTRFGMSDQLAQILENTRRELQW